MESNINSLTTVVAYNLQAENEKLRAALIMAREAIKKQQNQLRILIPGHGMVNDERMALIAGDEALTAINEVLS